MRHCLPIQKVRSLSVPVRNTPRAVFFYVSQLLRPVNRADRVVRPYKRLLQLCVRDVEDAVPYRRAPETGFRRKAVFFLRNLDNRGYGGYNIKLQHPI